MHVIYRYSLGWTREGYATIRAPTGKLLKVARREGLDQVWMLVDPDQPPIAHRFRMVMTGEDGEHVEAVFTGWKYIDTLFVNNIVAHIFKEPA